MKLCGSTSPNFFAGFPTTIILERIFFVTTAPAPIIASCPISTPGQIVDQPPIAQPRRNFAPLIVDGTSRKCPMGELLVKLSSKKIV